MGCQTGSQSSKRLAFILLDLKGDGWRGEESRFGSLVSGIVSAYGRDYIKAQGGQSCR